MKNRFSIAGCILALFILLSPAAFGQEDMEKIDNSVFTNPQRPPSVFVHDTHNENAGIEECNTCHHVYENGVLVEDESSEDQRCSDCHSESQSGKRPRLMKAFHLKCKQCHEKKKAGPVICGECHVR